jgi:O-antigen/teichoic acid export membrane protein
MSIAGIFSVIATGRYELAIMLPKKEEDAANIVALSIVISFFLSLLALIVVFFFNHEICVLLNNESIGRWLYFAPLSILFTGIYQSFNYWSNRQKQFKRLAINRVIQSGSTASTNVILGFAKTGVFGLVFGTILGQVLSAVMLVKVVLSNEKEKFKKIDKIRMLALARRYSSFPKFDVLSSLSNAAAQQLTSVFFNSFYNATIAGYYFMTFRMMSAPVTLIAASVQDVFKEQASADYKAYGNARNIYKSTFKKLALLSLIPTIVVFFYSKDIFLLFLGPKWGEAGVYARILTPMLFLRFISSPLSFMLFIGEKQHLNLFGNVLFLILSCLSFYLASTPIMTVYFLSASFSFIYLMYLFFSAKIAKVI